MTYSSIYFWLYLVAFVFVYYLLVQHDNYIDDFYKAIELEPNDTDAYFNRGIVYVKLEQHDKASDDVDKAIELERNGALH